MKSVNITLRKLSNLWWYSRASFSKQPSHLQSTIEKLANQPNSLVSLQHLIQTGSLALAYSEPSSPTLSHADLPTSSSIHSHGSMHPSRLSQLLIQNAQFLVSELPRRLAKRCRAFQLLPYIVGTNPHIHQVSSLYHQSLQTLLTIPSIKNEKEEQHFDLALSELVQAHLHVIPTLAQGFIESSKYMTTEQMNHFLDELIHARIGVRVLAEHHLALHRPLPNFVGIIDFKLHPYQFIQKIYHALEDSVVLHFGRIPRLEIQGDLKATLAYIPVHLEYILTELFKNSIRATLEKKHLETTLLPPIQVTIANAEKEMVLRIRDQGGGIPSHVLPNIFDYAYTTAKPKLEEQVEEQQQPLNDFQSVPFSSSRLDVFAGQGYGLGTSRVYSRFFGGSLTFVSLEGHGCDIFLRLKKLDAKNMDIQI